MTVCFAGVEKSGAFTDFLASLTLPRVDGTLYCVPSHGAITTEIQQRPVTKNRYGFRANWGEKAFAVLADGSRYVLSLPAAAYSSSLAFPCGKDLPGLGRILATLPRIEGHRFENSLFPVSLANEASSLALFPCAGLLRQFACSNTLKGGDAAWKRP